MHLTVTAASQAAFRAAVEMITIAEITRRAGRVTIGTPLDIIFHDSRGRHYRVSVPASAELAFWHNGGSSYGQKSKGSTYSKSRCTLFAPDSSFQLRFDSGRDNTFVFQWLANRPMPEIEMVDVG